MQFDGFRGQTFLWVLENALGYAGWLVDSMQSETVTSSALSQNKASFKTYANLFPECREVIAKKKEQRLNKTKEQETMPAAAVTPGTLATRVHSSTFTERVVTSAHRITAAIFRNLANTNCYDKLVVSHVILRITCSGKVLLKLLKLKPTDVFSFVLITWYQDLFKRNFSDS